MAALVGFFYIKKHISEQTVVVENCTKKLSMLLTILVS